MIFHGKTPVETRGDAIKKLEKSFLELYYVLLDHLKKLIRRNFVSKKKSVSMAARQFKIYINYKT